MSRAAHPATAIRPSTEGPGAVPIAATERRHRPRASGPPLAILHLITRLERGGSSDCTILQAIGAARRGHRVTLAFGPSTAPSALLLEARRQRGLELIEVPSLVRAPSPVGDARALVGLVRLLRARRFDILHTHTSKAGAVGRIAAALVPPLPVVHQPHGHLFYGYHGRLGTRLVILAERILAPLAARQIVLSWRGAEEHLARGVGRPGQFTVVRSGIDLRPFRRAHQRREASRARLGLRPEEFAVGTLCRLEPIKGVEELLEGFLLAAARRPRLRLIIGGDGPLAERLLSVARKAGGQERVIVTGSWMAAQDLLPALDLFALVSRNEGMGRALVEAMASRLPILATNVGGMPEVLQEGRAGLLVPPADAQAIAGGIARLMDDPRLALELARHARARSVVFGAGRMGHALLRVYREVLS
jgi:glycosyltransferase involved in cell wall biosynthesis